MVLGAQQESGYGALLLYSSADGCQWTSAGVIGTSQEYQMIECPDLFMLNEKMVLLYCPQHRDNAVDDCIDSFSVYRVLQNVSENMEHINLDAEWTRLDEGFDFYAPQTFLTPDGRRILLAWMSRIEGKEESSFAAHEPRIHCLTMPRELFLCGSRLCQRPIRELQNLTGISVLPQRSENGQCCYPKTRAFRLTPESKGLCDEVRVVLHEGEWSFHYDACTNRAQVCRRRWTDAGQDVRSISLLELKTLELWCDQSSAELFLNNGEYVFSARISPDAQRPSVVLSGVSADAVHVTQLPENLYQLFPDE